MIEFRAPAKLPLAYMTTADKRDAEAFEAALGIGLILRWFLNRQLARKAPRARIIRDADLPPRSRRVIFHGRVEPVIASILESVKAGARYVDGFPEPGEPRVPGVRVHRRDKLVYQPGYLVIKDGELAQVEAVVAEGQERKIEKQFDQDGGELGALTTHDAILAEGCERCGKSPAKCSCMDPLYMDRADREDAAKGGYAGFADTDERREELARTRAYWKAVERVALAKAELLDDERAWKRGIERQLASLNRRWSVAKLTNDDIALKQIRGREYGLAMRLEEGFTGDEAARERCKATRARERREEIADELHPNWRTWQRPAPVATPVYRVTPEAVVAGHRARINQAALEGELDPRKADRALRFLDASPELVRLDAAIIAARAHGDIPATRALVDLRLGLAREQRAIEAWLALREEVRAA